MYQLQNSSSTANLRTLCDVLVELNNPINKNARVFQSGVKMKVIQNSYGKYGVDLSGEGSVKDVFMRLFNEVDIHYVRTFGSVRRPEQMHSYEWKAFVALSDIFYGVCPGLSTDQRHEHFTWEKEGIPKSGTVTAFLHDTMFERFGYGHNGPLYGPNRDSNSRHEVHVAFALAEGKDVPESVQSWYRERNQLTDSVGAMFPLLLFYPQLRGALPVEVISIFSSIAKHDKLLDSYSITHLIEVMREFNGRVSYSAIETHLYQKGILKLRDPRTFEVCDLSGASEFALALRKALCDVQIQDSLERAEQRLKDFQISLRQYTEEVRDAKLYANAASIKYPNEMAVALESKNIEFLLSLLDQAGDSNITSKRLIREFYGLDVIGLNQTGRRKAIFAFCGYDQAMQNQYLLGVIENKTENERVRLIENTKELAKKSQVRFEGVVISVAEYIDRCVSRGYTVITTARKGAAKLYWLRNPETCHLTSLRVKDGSLDYAKLVHGLPMQVA